MLHFWVKIFNLITSGQMHHFWIILVNWTWKLEIICSSIHFQVEIFSEYNIENINVKLKITYSWQLFSKHHGNSEKVINLEMWPPTFFFLTKCTKIVLSPRVENHRKAPLPAPIKLFPRVANLRRPSRSRHALIKVKLLGIQRNQNRAFSSQRRELHGKNKFPRPLNEARSRVVFHAKRGPPTFSSYRLRSTHSSRRWYLLR